MEIKYDLESAKEIKHRFYLFYNDIPFTDIIADYEWVCELRTKCQNLAEYNYDDGGEYFVFPLLGINRLLYRTLEDYEFVKADYKNSPKSCYEEILKMYDMSSEFLKEALKNWGIS